LDHPAIQKLVETTPELKDKLMQAVMDSSNVASAAVGATAAGVASAFTGERKNESSEQNDEDDENSSKQGE
jgi:ribosomal protein L12E/L44/L45/RPP1/RPP2